ncbi:MAG: imidazoleglycerol-phosphate dehydratase [Spirochaetes bacterium GWF1_31_7]|nr:MAG: imidazoleglycerol-phosphate dehydratase [Spirochaetes bacterium GWE1_32_154]OHD50070.1 MAG: imidazoleglycerol-phosphate dehydratase [Spirochaetes bacterium GWE2_31_10]OHD52383.1 MAG: imidazoleglycerol-phosphate dehydratase [Spirochaetes bacterium GWF1_31_7]OHD81304.1 MAG: imidazoleglycerol-phosphate dehydratase [Spirochaetes bacterium RIFOXYB1_FULL_32_8]HBD96027.1 imidazoleglycerol-phosphate dehydratase HisB [Spirochaetia bacterium]
MRKAELERVTKETNIKIALSLDGSGHSVITTGIPFFDHMLTAFSKHSGFDLELKAVGDIEVDYHHTIEDCGIALGTVFLEALGDKIGIERFASARVPLDEAMTEVVVDISGRPFLHFDLIFKRPDDGNGVNPYLFEEFYRAFVNSARLTMHVDYIRGDNSHHIIESSFKAFAKALKKAATISGRSLPSTKGVL